VMLCRPVATLCNAILFSRRGYGVKIAIQIKVTEFEEVIYLR